MRRRISALAMLPLVLSLAACGGDDEPLELGLVEAQTADDTLYNLADGGAQFNDEGHAVSLNYNEDTTQTVNAKVVGRVVKDDNGDAAGIELQVDGRTFLFDTQDPADPDYGLTNAAQDSSLWSQSGTVAELLDPANDRYSAVLGYQVFNGDDQPNTRGYFVVGGITPEAQMPTTATATYSGRARLDLYPTTGFVDNQTTRTVMQGDVGMEADFAANTLTGTIDNIEARVNGGATTAVVGGAMDMSDGTITGSSFAGTFVPNDAVTDVAGDEFTASAKGRFYGPNAEEIGGTLGVQTETLSGSGYINGTQVAP